MARDAASPGAQASVIDESSAGLLQTRRDLETALRRLADLHWQVGANGDMIASKGEASSALSAREGAKGNRLDSLVRQLDSLSRQLQRDLETVADQGSQLEPNGVWIFETLTNVDVIEQELARVQQAQQLAARCAVRAESAGSPRRARVSQRRPLVAGVLYILVPLAVVLDPADPRAGETNALIDRGRTFAWSISRIPQWRAPA
jgi:ABC-type transporter Mla subunit MlaD